MHCELCTEVGGELIIHTNDYRVVLVDNPYYPGYCRVIYHHHIKEMTDLSVEKRMNLMHMVWQVEVAIRDVLSPDKINLASLGNQVPHLHWHIVPRFKNDPHFPNPIWGEKQREGLADFIQAKQCKLLALKKRIQNSPSF